MASRASHMMKEERRLGRSELMREEGPRVPGLDARDRRGVVLGEAAREPGRAGARACRRASRPAGLIAERPDGKVGRGEGSLGSKARRLPASVLQAAAPAEPAEAGSLSDGDDASRELVGRSVTAAKRVARAAAARSWSAKRPSVPEPAFAGRGPGEVALAPAGPRETACALPRAAAAPGAHAGRPRGAGELARGRAARAMRASGARPDARPAAGRQATRRARTAQARAAWQREARGKIAVRAASSASRKAAGRGAAAAARSVLPKAAAALAPVLLAACLVLLVAFLPTAGCTSAVADEGAGWGMEGLSDTERAIASYLRDKGLDQLHVAAIMGNMYQESNCRPEVEQVPGGAGGIGLCQWGHGVDGGRGDAMAAWAASRGKEWSDLYVQLDWLWAEMTNEGPAANQTSWYFAFSGPLQMERFKAQTTVAGATEFWQLWIEAAGDARMEQRIAYANRYLAIFRAGSGAESLPAGSVEAVVAEAHKHLGLPYVWGGTTPAGFDCSGFVKWCFEQNGFDLLGARTAQQLYDVATPVAADEAVRGDIVCFTYGAPNAGESMGHIGIYLGDGTMIHSGGYPEMVQVSPTGPNGYYARFAAPAATGEEDR